MSGNAFVGDQVLVDASFDAARCQLRHLASDGVLLGASKYACRAGITGLIQAAGPAAALPPPAGVEPGVRRNGWACPAVAALARDRFRQRRIPGSRCQPGAFPGRGADHGPRGGRGIPAGWPGGNRAGPGHGALLRRRDQLALSRTDWFLMTGQACSCVVCVEHSGDRDAVAGISRTRLGAGRRLSAAGQHRCGAGW